MVDMGLEVFPYTSVQGDELLVLIRMSVRPILGHNFLFFVLFALVAVRAALKYPSFSTLFLTLF